MGFSMTSARMLRFFVISSRSPVRRPKAFGKSMLPDAAGGSSGEDIGAAGAAADACGLAGSLLAAGAGAVSFLPQAISVRRANKVSTNTKTWRDEAESVHIHLLRYADKLWGACNCRITPLRSAGSLVRVAQNATLIKETGGPLRAARRVKCLASRLGTP